MRFKRENNKSAIIESIDQDMIERKKRRTDWYRKYAQLKEGDTIDMNNLDEWALRAAGCEGRCSIEDIKEALQESILTEAPTSGLKGTLKQAADAVDAKEVTAENQTRGQIESALDRALKTAKRMAGKEGVSYPNVLFISEAGMGKTSICRAWARANGVNLVEVRGSTLDPTDIGGLFAQPEKGATRAKKIATGIFEPLEQPNSVLFLDELNRASTPVRNALLELVNSHYLPDPNNPQGGQLFLPNFLFTIATINPPSGDYNVTPLDPAESSRFRNIQLTADNKYILRYLEKKYTEEAAEARKAGDEEAALESDGRKKLAQTLLNSNKFAFDDREEIIAGRDALDYLYHPLNYRSLTELLDTSDGTKQDLLDLWSEIVNPRKKNVAELILANYKDVEDKANAALADGTESEVFAKKVSLSDRLKKAYPDLNV